MPRRPFAPFPLFAALWLGLTATLAPAQTPAPVDTSPAIEIGSYQVSHYLVRKYYGRYAAGLDPAHHRAPTLAEAQVWLDRFVARHTLIARVRADGGFDAPEVREAVSTMEQHMLTMPEGPFYATLLARAGPPDDATLRRRYGEGSRPVDCIVVATDDAATAERALGRDFLSLPPAAQLQRAQQAQARPDARYFAGTVQWPFDPFSEIGDRLIAAPVGTWQRFDDPDFGVFFVLKQSAGPPRNDSFARDRDGFSHHAAFVDRQLFVRRRHAALLRAAAFSLDATASGRLSATLATLQTPSDTIPPEAVANDILYRFKLEGHPVEVATRAWVAEFNRQFLRRVPRTAADLRAMVEDAAVRQLDLAEARALGIDRLPQFVEDRLGYTALQALDLYERRELAPTLPISDQTVEAYYNAHRSEYQRTVRISGRLVAFATAAEASAWLRSPAPLGAPVASGSEPVQAVPGQLPHGFEPYEQVLFSAPPGFAVGPTARDGRFFVLQKTADAERGLSPLSEMRDRIRAVLLRAALDRREEELAPALQRTLPAKVNITAAELAAGSPVPRNPPAL